MARGISSAAKLEGMYELFTRGDNALGRGEVDALSGWYQALTARSQGAVKDRMLEIYQGSEFQRGQKEWFRRGLMDAGFTLAELEGVDPNTPDGFAQLSKQAQYERLRALRGFLGEGAEQDISWNQINAGARPKIRAAIEAFQEDFEGDQDIPVYYTGESVTAIYLGERENGRPEGLVGYAVEVGIDIEYEADRTLYFNRTGEHLGTVYSGE